MYVCVRAFLSIGILHAQQFDEMENNFATVCDDFHMYLKNELADIVASTSMNTLLSVKFKYIFGFFWVEVCL